MDCNQVDRLLDALMDDVISQDEREALEAHCDACAACAAKLNATRDMMRLFADMAPEVDVPLQVQANWRKAVKAEAGKRGLRRFYRLAGGIAAVLVVALGTTFALRSRPAKVTAAPMMDAAMGQSVAMIEADGQTDEESIDTAVSRAMPMHEISMTVKDIDKTCEYMSDLVSEYEGEMDDQRFEEDGKACANLYIEMPAENAAEFLNAAAHYDLDGEDAIPSDELTAGERVSMLLVLKEG